MKFCIFTFFSLFFLSHLGYGNWVGGGGRITEEMDHNPWFIQNTPTVYYCISHDKESFSAESDQIRNSIKKSFDFWKVSFENARQRIPYEREFKVATQQLRQVQCPEDLDQHFAQPSADIPFIVFQFGSLTESQNNKLPEINKYVGMAVRTGYDQTQLRGQGFVYLRGDINSPDIEDKSGVWHKGGEGMLTLALIHELGHVFGIRHQQERMLMQEEFLTHLFFDPAPEKYLHYTEAPDFFAPRVKPQFGRVNAKELCVSEQAGTPVRSNEKNFSLIKALNGTLAPLRSYSKASPSKTFSLDSFLGVPTVPQRCYSVYETGEYDFEVYFETQGVESKVGHLRPADLTKVAFTMRPLVHVALPEDQLVYVDRKGRLEGMGLFHYSYGGFLRLTNTHVDKPVWVHHRSKNSLTVGAYVNQTPIIDIFGLPGFFRFE